MSGYADLPPGAANTLPRLSKPFRQDQLALAMVGAVAVEGAGRQVLRFRR